MFAGTEDRAGGRAVGRAGRGATGETAHLRRSRLALFATAAATCACVGASPAGAPAPPAAAKEAPAGRAVSGRVLEAPGGRPAVGTTVSLWHSGDGRTRTTRTDRLGAYRFHDVPRSEYGYVLRVEGLPTGVWSEGAAVRVFKRDVRADELYVKRPQGLSGTVRDAEGRPVGGASLYFSTADAKGNRAAATTDGKGRFCLYTLPRDVALYCEGTHDRYYPTTGERTLTIRRGEVRADVDFVVLGAPSFRGRVLRGDGKPAANLTVLAMMHWSRASVQDGRRIAEARKRRDASTRDGREPQRPKLKPHVSPGWGESGFSAGIGKHFRLPTDEQGRFRGYLRRPFAGDRDEAIDVVVVTRLADRSQAGMAIVQTTTLDPSPPAIDVKLRPTGSAVFRVVNPDGKPVAEAKPGCRLELSGRSFGHGIAEAAPVLKALGGGRCRATGLVEGWRYGLYASAKGYRCPSQLRVTAKAGKHVDAGTLRLGWWGPKAVPELIRRLHSSHRYTREGTCRMLGSLGAVAAPAVGDLVDRLRNDRWNTVRYEAAAALGRIGPEAKGALPDLIAALKDDKLGVPREAAKALGLLGDRRALPALIEALHHRDRDARIEAIGALGRLGDPKALPHLKAALTDGVYHIREAALGALAEPAFRKADPGVAALLRLGPIVRDTGAMEIALPVVALRADERAVAVIERLGACRLPLKTALRILEVVTDEPFAGRFESPEDLLAWWWQLPLDAPAARGASPAAARMQALWGQLDDEAGPRAYRAMCALAAGGDEAVALVAERVGPVSAEPLGARRWIGDLDAGRYAARARAYDSLSLLGRRVEPALREALKSADSPEAKSRLESLLKALALPYPATPATRRAARAIRVLERIGTPKAAALLRRLARSAPGSLPAERAKAALRRIRSARGAAAGRAR